MNWKRMTAREKVAWLTGDAKYIEALSVELEGTVGLDSNGYIWRAGEKRKATHKDLDLIFAAICADVWEWNIE